MLYAATRTPHPRMKLGRRADFGGSVVTGTRLPTGRSCVDGVLCLTVGAQAPGDHRPDVRGDAPPRGR
jgi:hypothetical protein